MGEGLPADPEADADGLASGDETAGDADDSDGDGSAAGDDEATALISAFAKVACAAGLVASVGLATLAKWFAVLWLLYIVAFVIGPETRGRSLAELDSV